MICSLKPGREVTIFLRIANVGVSHMYVHSGSGQTDCLYRICVLKNLVKDYETKLYFLRDEEHKPLIRPTF